MKTVKKIFAWIIVVPCVAWVIYSIIIDPMIQLYEQSEVFLMVIWPVFAAAIVVVGFIIFDWIIKTLS